MRVIGLLSSVVALVIGTMALLPASSAEAWGTQVVASYSCDYGKITMTLTWSGNSPSAVGQYVQMSYTDNGWRPNTTTTVGPFHPSVNTMTWDGLAQGTRHFLRFTQQFPDGSWDPSLTFRFDTPWCDANGIPTFLPTTPNFFAGSPLYTTTLVGFVDYDCAGGPGEPPFVQGAVSVEPGDPFGLDADGDGIGCESPEG